MSEEELKPTQDQLLDPNRRIEPSSVPYRYSKEVFEAPKTASVTEFERTPEGYTEIEWQYRDLQHALALDFDQYALSKMGLTREQIEQQAKAQIDQLNESRKNIGAEPIDPTKINGNFLIHLAHEQSSGEDTDSSSTQDKLKQPSGRYLERPKWQDYLPTDGTEESLRKWEDFKSQYPEPIQINLEELSILDGKLRILSEDEQLREAVSNIHGERLAVMRAASAYMGADRKIEVLSRKIADMYKAAGASGRSLTAAEQRHIASLQERQTHIRQTRGERITSPELLTQVKEELRKRKAIENRRDFERGIVLTDQMHAIINELIPSLAQGRPALLVGETGGAKTALAEYISREYFGVEPEFISGYGDVNSYQVMGKMNLKNDDGTPVSDFVPGPIIRAMEAGKPLIIDEINAMPPEFLKRLNKILQLKPGDTFTVQEDSGREVTIKPGFVIIATANEKSKRYKGVEDLSVEFQNRFGANVVRVKYPDSDVVYGQAPVENATIAVAALTDRSGNLVGGIDINQLEAFVRACHVTQQVFSGNFGKGFDMYVSTEQLTDSKPGLDEAVLAPRTMVALLEKVRYSNGQVNLDQAITRFVSGIKSQNDRRTMTTILQGNGFMQNQG